MPTQTHTTKILFHISGMCDTCEHGVKTNMQNYKKTLPTRKECLASRIAHAVMSTNQGRAVWTHLRVQRKSFVAMVGVLNLHTKLKTAPAADNCADKTCQFLHNYTQIEHVAVH